ncbi:Transmembrane protein 72 [Labeo rohita]|uniref:Transmembrane protein 72 n=1 Tax=Labeo rohita TaxID=84645 RepID=A0ABQ8M4T3_LABRO|nr:Transmembrane protein 72 [Labeo rohita]
MLFEVAYFIDALLSMCLPYVQSNYKGIMCLLLVPPHGRFSFFGRSWPKSGGFQKFLYYTMMSLMCFLHPVLVWHAVIPGIMLVVTGFFNFILSKKKKSDPPKESRVSYGDPALSSVCVTDREDAEHTFSVLHVISGKRASFFPSNSRLHGPTDRAQTVKNDQRKNSQTDTRNMHFIESLRHNDTEMEEYHEVEAEETTSDKAPMIRLHANNGVNGLSVSQGNRRRLPPADVSDWLFGRVKWKSGVEDKTLCLTKQLGSVGFYKGKAFHEMVRTICREIKKKRYVL